ncbi:uncharacterized protein AC631_05893 [Debaryomyces fabryi]|uniref:Zn(2)-C6 fungal-type domain-containing protein n=1 Tax=Debaryomyces fabryi TaxID=58627 RepID=A0A0V1PQL9_9ASCO|nr:uncharacterized protein AC631_05893 [Debaryomyces fabryi]KRZ98347.1 hypothetical protein AC631_05893 [Debaryomyces fabryi]CUM49437.1 unnamed protein product [Debaryomyces fabryi]
MVSDKENGTTRKTTRRKIAIACEGCRQRKRRCDGAQPVCGICRKRNVACVYSRRYTKTLANAENVKNLEGRLGILQDDESKPLGMIRSSSITSKNNSNNNELGNQDLITCSRTNSLSASHDYLYSSDSHQGSNQGLKNPNASPVQNFKATFRFKNEDLTSDAMGAGSKTAPHKTGDKSFYGRSAAMSLMEELFASIDAEPLPSFGSELMKSNTYKMSRSEKEKSSISLSRIVVPPRRVADDYIKTYFEFTYPLYPFIHKPTFMSAYKEIWSRDTNNCELDELFYCILNIIFAFGCHLSPLEKDIEGNEMTNVYFERSQDLLKFHLMDTGSLLLVQALLLTGQFLQATIRLEGCWNIVGLTIRIAQGLGLHMERNTLSQRSYIEQEVEKRLWHGCLLMDKIVSLTFGRPLMVVEDNVSDMPIFIDDEYVTDTAINYPQIEKPSVLSFFSQTLKLYNILADILKSFYSDPFPEYVDLFPNIFSFQKRLYVFQDKIPNHIKYDCSLHESPYQHQSIVLQIRCLHLKIMLYRPVLLPRNKDQVYSGINNMELYVSTRRAISKLCVDSAMELIDVIKRFKSTELTLLPSSWYNVFYIYTAALILLAAKLQPDLEDNLDKTAFELSWTNALKLLASYESQSKSATRCLKVLEVMDCKIKLTIEKRSKKMLEDHQPNENVSTSSQSEAPSDFLYSLMYDTEGPFGSPFFYNNRFDSAL